MMRKLTEPECRAAILAGEFSTELRSSAPRVAIVLTQSWCPQWTWMKGYLPDISSSPDVAVLWVEYDREAFFEDFLPFKEDVLGNREIPYVRYYRDGAFLRSSNYIDKGGFLRILA